jgi:hypothetical protein
LLGATDFPSHAVSGPVELITGQTKWFSICGAVDAGLADGELNRLFGDGLLLRV